MSMNDDRQLGSVDVGQTREYVEQMVVELAKLLFDADEPEFAQALLESVKAQREKSSSNR